DEDEDDEELGGGGGGGSHTTRAPPSQRERRHAAHTLSPKAHPRTSRSARALRGAHARKKRLSRRHPPAYLQTDLFYFDRQMASTVHRHSTPTMPYFPDITAMRSNATRPKAKDWSDLASAPLKPATRSVGGPAPACSVDEEPQHYLHSLRRNPNFGEYTAAEVTRFPLAAKSQLAFSPPKLPSPPDTPATVEDAFDMGSHTNMMKLEKMLDDLQLDSDRTALRSADKSDMQVKQRAADPSAVQGNAHGLPTRLGSRSATPSASIAAGVPPVSRPYGLPGLAGQLPTVFAPSQGYAGVQQRPSQSSVVHPPIRGALRTATSCGMLPFDYPPPGALPDVGKTVGSAPSLYGVLLPIAERNSVDSSADVARSTRAWHAQANLAGEEDNQACHQSRGQLLVPTSFSASSTSSGTVLAAHYNSRPQSRQVFSIPVSSQNGWVFDENAQLIDPLDGM
ncbi:MAG: hypothetical protein BJ554DRAFT_6623, partial [Olpidium bornovanus]